ncbi:hypothetical protein [Hahella ganghwensis]|nr:hypothetical protein [Hahella ganghwensis]
MAENNNQSINQDSDSKVDAIAAVVLVVSIATMMIMWVASH